LKKAASMLAEGEYRIYEIADMTGFSSQSNFARNFSKQFNMTPSEYIALKQSGETDK
jgi:AraC-like DNA-binding protein